MQTDKIFFVKMSPKNCQNGPELKKWLTKKVLHPWSDMEYGVSVQALLAEDLSQILGKYVEFVKIQGVEANFLNDFHNKCPVSSLF